MTTTRHAAAAADEIGVQAGTRAFGLQHGLEFDAATGPAPAFDRSSNGALLDRIQTLRTILPAMATEVAIARREGARLRRENATLRGRLAAIENRRGAAGEVTPTAQESR